MRVGASAQPTKAAPIPIGANALSKEDDAVIRGIEDEWNSDDMKAYAKPLRDDVVRVNVVGMRL